MNDEGDRREQKEAKEKEKGQGGRAKEEGDRINK